MIDLRRVDSLDDATGKAIVDACVSRVGGVALASPDLLLADRVQRTGAPTWVASTLEGALMLLLEERAAARIDA